MARSVALAVAAMACASAAIVAAACIVPPPPQNPQESPQPPVILGNSAMPPLYAPLLQWPDGGFVVPVNPEWPDNPTAPPSALVYIDNSTIVPTVQASVPDDAGLSRVSFVVRPADLNPPIDNTVCHTVVLTVARVFNGNQPGPPGSASVSWTYAPNAPYQCLDSSLDGQAPPPDAADGAFTPPSSEGGGPEP